MRHAMFRCAPLAILIGLCFPYAYGTAAQPFGEWESSIALELATRIWSIETDFTLGCALADWAAESRTLIENNEWKNQDFELIGSIGGVNIESDLRFEPYKNRFRDWITELEWETEDFTFTLTSKLTRTTDWLILELEREWDAIEVDASFRLRAPTGACGLLFYDADVELDFEWCGIETELAIAMDDDGFDELGLKFADIVHPRVPWATFDLEITRTLSTTTIELTPELALTTPWCAAYLDLEFDGTLPSAPSLFPLTIDEVALSWELGDWEIEATAYADPNDWIDDLYWLELQAESELDLDPCGELSLELEFLWTETDPGKLTGTLSYEPSKALTVGFALIVDYVAQQIEMLEMKAGVVW